MFLEDVFLLCSNMYLFCLKALFSAKTDKIVDAIVEFGGSVTPPSHDFNHTFATKLCSGADTWLDFHNRCGSLCHWGQVQLESWPLIMKIYLLICSS